MAAIINSNEVERKIFLSNEDLQCFGCKTCVWKNYGQCPHGLTEPDQSVAEGYCTELGEFILGLGSEDDSISAIMEKFFIYTQRIQAMVDNTEYHQSLKKLKEFKSKHHPELTPQEYKQKLGELEMDVTSSKIWWSRLTESIIKGLGKIVDRESRSKDIKGVQKITVQQLNCLLKESDNLLENNNDN